ncbi:hypothetical protein [Caballeronia sp. DA-9]|uniref:hypothetical protein n=1 Tax=Caballeronia sp. DA-9 TaxID=3436237 RepID=UPI003F6677E6
MRARLRGRLEPDKHNYLADYAVFAHAPAIHFAFIVFLKPWILSIPIAVPTLSSSGNGRNAAARKLHALASTCSFLNNLSFLQTDITIGGGEIAIIADERSQYPEGKVLGYTRPGSTMLHDYPQADLTLLGFIGTSTDHRTHAWTGK